MNPLDQYLVVMPKIQPGDIIAFWGKGLISWAIELWTGGPSHIAVVRQPFIPGVVGKTFRGEPVSHQDVKIIESTVDKGTNGVQTNGLGERIAHYHGSINWLPLRKEIRELINWKEFWEFCGACEGRVGYDTDGLFEVIARQIPILGTRLGQAEHPGKMFCSAFAVALFEHCGILRGINWAKQSPIDVVEMNLYDGYEPLLGNKKMNPKRFNCV